MVCWFRRLRLCHVSQKNASVLFRKVDKTAASGFLPSSLCVYCLFKVCWILVYIIWEAACVLNESQHSTVLSFVMYVGCLRDLYTKVQYIYTTILQRIAYILTVWLFYTLLLYAEVANLVLCSISLVGSLMMIPWGSKHVGIVMWYYNINI